MDVGRSSSFVSVDTQRHSTRLPRNVVERDSHWSGKSVALSAALGYHAPAVGVSGYLLYHHENRVWTIEVILQRGSRDAIISLAELLANIAFYADIQAALSLLSSHLTQTG